MMDIRKERWYFAWGYESGTNIDQFKIRLVRVTRIRKDGYHVRHASGHRGFYGLSSAQSYFIRKARESEVEFFKLFSYK